MKTVIAAILGILITHASAVAEVKQSDSRRTTNIPAQELGSALRNLAKARKFQIVYSTEEVSTLRTPGAVGELTPEEALKQLLSGTGLSYRYLSPKTVTIFRPAPSSASGAPADQMRLASSEEKSDGVREQDAEKDSQQVIVKDTKIRLSEPNLDLQRTMEDIQPYYIYDSEAIVRSGAVTIEEFLKQRVTMNTVAMSRSQGAGGEREAGSSTNRVNDTTVNLRGLGEGQTLVLINGRRVNGGSYGEKLNEIPASSIDRVEVLPTSASAIYGGNAIGGVINVVLKRDYTGGTVAVGYDRSEHANDPRRTASASYGWSMEGGRTRITTSGNWSDAQPMVMGDRADLYLRSLDTIMANNPNFIFGSSLLLGALPNIRADDLSVTALTLKDGRSLGSPVTHVSSGITTGTRAEDRADDLFANRNTWELELADTPQGTGLRRPLDSPSVNKSFGLSVQRQMLPWLDLLAEFRHNKSTTRSIALGLPTTFWVNGTIGSQPVGYGISPINPFNETVQVALPINYDLPITGSSFTDMGSLSADVRLPGRWQAMVDYAHTRTGWAVDGQSFDWDAVQTAIAAGTFNPFVDTFQQGYDWSPFTTREQQDVRNNSDQFTVRAGGPLFALPWGEPRLNLGFDRTIFTVPQYLGTRFGSSSNIMYERQALQTSAYAETLLPLVRQDAMPMVRTLELQLIARVDRYTRDSGTTGEVRSGTGEVSDYIGSTRGGEPYSDTVEYSSSNYTVGLKYEPIAGLALRISRSTAFLPPSPEQLQPPQPTVQPEQGFIETSRDPFEFIFVDMITGGDPGLKPQNSSSFNAGLLFEPAAIPGMRFNVEYYKIEQQDFISTLGPQYIYDHAADFPDRILRDGNGVVTGIIDTYMNVSNSATEGMDFRVDYNKRTAYGDFGLSAAHTLIQALKMQNLPDSPVIDTAGYPAESGAARTKSNLQLNWERNQVAMSWAVTRFGDYKIYGAAGGPVSLRHYGGQSDPNYFQAQGGTDTVPAQAFHDLAFSYNTLQEASGRLGDLFGGMTLRAGVRNLFGTEPKLDVSYGGNYYRSPYGGTRLRSYWFNVQKAF